eukprot:gb/GFBE01075477.1/.p1 GENE.gb/GFBE01075477.1/~~gb/GFBE01075477.1/.p1  ORF type:complete len:172 (+),score=9.69 gb/GFBE01075477.1/:1-516(+)
MELSLTRAYSEPAFVSTFGRSFPHQAARSVTLSRLEPESGPGLLSPQFDASFKQHTFCASLGPRREPFRNTQKYWARPSPKPTVDRKPYILGRQLQRGPRKLPTIETDGCPVSSYSGIVQWGSGGRKWHDTPSPTGSSFMASIGKTPTGRGGDPRKGGSRPLALPRIVPGF